MKRQDTKNEGKEMLTSKEYFDVLFTYALMYGMSYEDFWHNSNYELYWFYREKYRQEKEMERILKRDNTNFGAWLNGIYMQSVLSGLFGKNNYPSEPIDFNAMEKEANRRAKMTEEERYLEDLKAYEEESKANKRALMAQLPRKEN